MHHVALVVWRLDRLEDLSDNYLQMKKKTSWNKANKMMTAKLVIKLLIWQNDICCVCCIWYKYLNSIIYVNSKVLIGTYYWVKLFKIHFLLILSKSRAGVTSWLLTYFSISFQKFTFYTEILIRNRKLFHPTKSK